MFRPVGPEGLGGHPPPWSCLWTSTVTRHPNPVPQVPSTLIYALTTREVDDIAAFLNQPTVRESGYE